ncbi:signal peptide peptidase SppA [Mitsuaria sp. CC2]|jgi:protease IV|uniref:signal peptide peptidase SppA n=1 Tax=Mitsuaria sp. CC2 TaxID=3029186 RepID=UPI003B8BC987
MGVKRVLAPVGRFFGGVWWFLNGTRRVVFTLLFWVILIALIWAAVHGGKPLQDKTTLVLDIRGDVVEQFSGSPREQAIAQIKGEARAQTRLRDILRALDAAAKDDHIVQVVLNLDQMGSATPAALHEIEAALTRFKASKKPVVAAGLAFDQRSYYLAAQATEVYVHPMGGVLIEGYGRYRNYYKDALDRVGISPNVLRVGTYKNAVEPYFANGPSPATMEADAYLYDELWARYQTGVETARKLPKGSLQRAIDELPERLKAVGGDPGKFVLAEKLVDGLKTEDEVEALLEKRGVKDEKRLRQIGLGAYVAQLPPTLPKPEGQVGVIVAEGEIVDGSAGPGKIGGESMSKLIRQAREDEKIKAVVLRVNSPGGSAFASELVRRELELTRAVGKPVVVSMGGVAASGGYWISMSSDEVIADASTITGSIGVFGMLPTGEKLLDKLSIHTGGYTTTWLANGYDPRRPLDPRMAQVVQSSIEHIYADFTGKAAQARKKSSQQIDAVGQGRVWTGSQALERGLVDRNGLLADAIASAAKRAKLGDEPTVRYVEPDRSTVDRLLSSMGDAAAPSLRGMVMHALGGIPAMPALPAPLRDAQVDITWLAEQAEAGPAGSKPPVRAIVHCLCTAP